MALPSNLATKMINDVVALLDIAADLTRLMQEHGDEGWSVEDYTPYFPINGVNIADFMAAMSTLQGMLGTMAGARASLAKLLP
jgi:hypothetical protein